MYAARAAIACCLALVLAGCAGGGGKGSDPAPIALAVEHVTLRGEVADAGASAVELRVDGAVVPVAGGAWSHVVDLVGVRERTVAVDLYVDGALVSAQEVRVRR